MKYSIRLSILFTLLVTILCAQEHTIDGVVTDKLTGTAISKVNIVIKETDIGTSTDDNGYFNLNLIEKLPVTLSITHIGYYEKEVTVENNVRLSIQLNQKILEGKEVIIEGVQKHSNREVSSKIEVVELKEIEKRGVRDISEILNEIDGVNINTTSFGKQSISIRGSNPNEIAVYIDGIKLNNSATGAADLAYIDLADLDEIEVIKGGSSTLFGPGNFGGVVLLHSKRPLNNSIEYNRGFGITDENDQDLSIAGNIKIGPLGGYGRYSGKSRLFDGRTLFTSVFGNYGGLLSFENQELTYKHVDYDKFIEFPSGGIVSSDELKVDRITFIGNIFGSTGWDIQYGRKNWTWEDTFYSNIIRDFSDDVEQYRINKGFKYRNFSGSLQVEYETQKYIGDQLISDSYSTKNWKSVGTLEQNDKGIASVLRYDVHNPTPNIDLLRWEGGLRISKSEYKHTQNISEYDERIEYKHADYDLDDILDLNTYRIGVSVEGNVNKNFYKIFISQGYNNRRPTLNDRFIWADGIFQLEEEYKRLNSYYDVLVEPQDIKDEMIRIQNILSSMQDGLGKEFVSTSEVNTLIRFDDFNDGIDMIELGVGMFRSNYLNKIAYYNLDNGILVPHTTNSAWINGAELSGKISIFDGMINIYGNITWVKPSDQEIFPNKPSSLGSIVLDIGRDRFHVNISHIFNGPQNYIHGGVSVDQLQTQQNTNLTASYSIKVWLFKTTLSYSARNIFSNEVTVLTAGSGTGDVFNYYDAHRELINLKLTLSGS